MAAHTGIKAVNQGARFLPLQGNAQQWIASDGAARWIDLAGSAQRGLRHVSSFMPLKGTSKSQEDPDVAGGKDAQALQAAQGFEQVFVQYLMKSMRKAVPDGGLLGNSFASGIYQGMFDEYLSEQAGKSSGLGIADVLYAEIARERQGRIAYQAVATDATDTVSSSTGQRTTPIEASGASPSSR